MICRNCGKEITDDAAFCMYCGAPAGADGSPAETDGLPKGDEHGAAENNYPGKEKDAENVESGKPEAVESAESEAKEKSDAASSRRHITLGEREVSVNDRLSAREVHPEDRLAAREVKKGPQTADAGKSEQAERETNDQKISPEEERKNLYADEPKRKGAGQSEVVPNAPEQPNGKVPPGCSADRAEEELYPSRQEKKKPVNKKKLRNVILAIVLIAVAIFVGIKLYTYMTRETINVSVKKSSVAISGFSGDASVDTDDVEIKIKDPEELGTAEGSVTDFYSEAQRKSDDWNKFQESLHVKFNKTKGLKNGDKLKAEVKTSYSRSQLRKLQKEFHVNIKGLNKEKTWKVKGLGERYKNAEEAKTKGAGFIAAAKKNAEYYLGDSDNFYYMYDFENKGLAGTYFARSGDKNVGDVLVLVYKVQYEDYNDDGDEVEKTEYLRLCFSPFNSAVTNFTHDDADFGMEESIGVQLDELDPYAETMTIRYSTFDSLGKAVADLSDPSEYSCNFKVSKIQ